MKIKVWDLPTRLFHWLLVLAFVGAYFTSGSDSFLEYHTIAGYLALSLVIFRVLWGFGGNRYARFSGFIKGWGAIKGYISEAVRLKPPRYIGHNPAVGWVILAILFVAAVLAASGVVTYGGEENRGVWANVFSFDEAIYAREIHEVLAYLMIVFIVVHISAALFHDFILSENIIFSMFTGTKEDDESWKGRVEHLAPDEGRSKPRLIVWLVVAIMGGLALVYLPPEGRGVFYETGDLHVVDEGGFVRHMAVNQAWKAECAASCHSAFHPSLLPAASWKKVMAGLDDHFGESVYLDDAAVKEIEEFLVAASAERSTTEAAKKFLWSVRKTDAPMRITDMPYWKKKHSAISEDVFKKKSVTSRSNCAACHPGAEVGSFEDKDISIPD